VFIYSIYVEILYPADGREIERGVEDIMLYDKGSQLPGYLLK
jgi:hypothetical protein